MAFVHLPQQGALQSLGKTAPTPRPSYCSERLVNHGGRSAVPHRLAQAHDAPVRRAQHNEMMRPANTVERVVPFVVAFDLPFYGRDLKIAERHIGEQRRELREKRQERFARYGLRSDPRPQESALSSQCRNNGQSSSKR